MEANFWHQRWAKNEIGFHEGAPNRLLVNHFGALSLAKGSAIFLPLCGKTRDIAWLMSNGYVVIGAELSELAVKQLFSELGVEPDISDLGKIKRYAAAQIRIHVGDIFDLRKEDLGKVEAIYDRAALVALPKDMRTRYATHLKSITGNAPMLLICFEYDQSVVDGPPFSISKDEVYRLYSDTYDLSMLEQVDVAGGMKGKCAASESIWHLKRKQSARE